MALPSPPLRLGERLVRGGRLSRAELARALAHQKCRGGRLGEVLVKLGLVPEAVVLGELARALGVARLDVRGRRVPPAIVRLLPEELIRRRGVLPVALLSRPAGTRLLLATSEPGDAALLGEVARASRLVVTPVLASAREIRRAIERSLARQDPPESLPLRRVA